MDLFEIFFPPVYVFTLLALFHFGVINAVLFAALLIGLPGLVSVAGFGVFLYYADLA